MIKTTLTTLALVLLCVTQAFADKDPENETEQSAEVDSTLMVQVKAYLRRDSIVRNLKFDTLGEVNLNGNFAKFKIPKGFKFLNPKQSIEVLTDIWGNPKDETILGMIFPDTANPMLASCWAFSIKFDEMGYVKDDDAEDVDYEELLEDMKKEVEGANKERMALGYGKVDFIGWAEKPYYDKDKKILYWAKELKFDEDSINTLNYNVRILGRKGVLIINAIGGMDQFQAINPHVKSINEAFAFEKGHTYDEYDSSLDKVAVYGIGGLVAGKVLAKVGIFALFGKFFKFILIGLAAAGGAIYKFFTGKKKDE